jgi:hypothetical protein
MKGFNLSEWAINHRSFVWFLMILFVAAGVLSYKQLGREEDPSFSIKTMILPPGAPPDCRRKATASRLPPHLVSNVERRMEDQGLTGQTSRRPIAAGQRLAPATGPKNRLIGSRLPNSGLQQIFE